MAKEDCEKVKIHLILEVRNCNTALNMLKKIFNFKDLKFKTLELVNSSPDHMKKLENET
eukprot:CAMPEP_0116873534 /NCGR_PEP_ID=MMETSP0463-20121206/4716_1 /TAXON_ID=181622 /ORGANISM="Strombidinopsis sp, Strain SopsisLIS2011" /LENGTH=58 /DNA_ID=CAMNT_0004515715 /DNA_START=355 /DNA_END=531 /DNA_ORIENTATION=-